MTVLDKRIATQQKNTQKSKDRRAEAKVDNTPLENQIVQKQKF